MRAYVIADNRLGECAGWDRDLLGIELQGLAEIAIRIEPTSLQRTVITDEYAWELALEADGDLVVVRNGAILRVDFESGQVSTITDDFRWSNVQNTVVAPDGTIYVAASIGTVVKLDPGTGELSVVFRDVDCEVNCS